MRVRNIAALSVLSLIVIAAPELLGGVYPWAMLSIAAMSVIGVAILASGRDPLPWSPMLSVVGVATLWTVLQWLPLPCALTRLIAPDSVLELGRARQLFGLPPPSLCSLSRAPSATREQVVCGIALLCTFWMSLALSRRGFRPVIHHAVAASCVMLAAVGVAHQLLDAKRVFGVYTPLDVHAPAILSPLLNVNTFGGVLAMGLPLLMALAVVERDKTRKAALLVANAVVVVAIFMSRSRGAIGAAVVGTIGFVLLTLLRWQGGGSRRLDWGKRAERVATPIALAFGFGVIGYVWNVETVDEIRHGGLDKLEVIGAASRFAWQHGLIGVGRGAFASTFAGPVAPTRFDYAENFVVQWAADWGIPIALFLLAAFAYSLFRALRRARSLDRIGALVGLATFGIQNLVDLGFELLGVGVLAIALFGAAITERQPLGETRADRRRALPALAWGFLTVAAASLVLWTQPVLNEHRASLEHALEDRLEAGDHRGFQALLRRSVLAHPSEPAYPLLAASEALARHDPNVGKWINRAMQLRPTLVGPHLQAAQWLWNSGRRPQALLELGIAMALDRYTSRTLLCPLAALDPGGVAAAIQPGPAREDSLEVVVACFQEDAAPARLVDAVILEEFPRDPRAHLREGRRRLAEHDANGALAQADLARAGEAQPKTESNALRARALAELGRVDEAIALLRETARNAVDPSSLLALEAELHCAKGDHRGMIDALERMRGAAAGQASSMAAIFQLQGKLEVRLGNLPAALQAYRQAYSIVGDTGSLSAIAEIAERAGDRGRALWAYRELCEGAGADRTACVKRDQLLSASATFEFPLRAAQPIQR